MWSQFRQWREDVPAAAGILAAVLDERYLGEEVLEDALIRDGEGELIADRVPWVRDYLQGRSFPMSSRLRSIEAMQDDPVAATAARWYLKAARGGSTADAIVAFWIALEALGEVTRDNVGRIHAKDADVVIEDPDLPDIGRPYGLRSNIVHHGSKTTHELARASRCPSL